MKKYYCLVVALFLFSAVNAQIISFPDANFKAKLLQSGTAQDEVGNPINIDSNSDGEIAVSEIQQVFYLYLSNAGISDLTGISNFTHLKILHCDNNSLTNITISPAVTLMKIDANHNALQSVDVHFDSVDAPIINLSYNNLTSFSLPANMHFDMVYLNHNQLSTLAFHNVVIDYLNVSFNNLTAIQATGYVDISYSASFQNNQFSLLDLSGFYFDSEASIGLGNNIIDKVQFGSYGPGNVYYSSTNTFLDLGNFRGTRGCDPGTRGNLSITNSPNLSYFVLKNGFNHAYITCNEGGDIFQISTLNLSIAGCPNLSFICVDEGEATALQNKINSLGLQNQVQVNSYCSFTPGGTYYTINGTTRSDANSNGCDSSDMAIPLQKFTITQGANSDTIISQAIGNYSIPVGSGTYTLTPTFENPTYYTVSPTSLTANFPSQSSPLTQDFCITPNGNHADLEVTILPIDPARPGFNATYKIVLRNKGNQTQSGNIGFAYDDAILDFVSATQGLLVTAPNLLVFDFDELQPFETHEISVTFNINSPVEIPAVNGGDILNYTATITSATDEMPEDNIFELHQTVVNSFDPNDKTCLEGATITPEMVGKEVRYMIRFENTGTANAENIVVKDLIDLTKFDVNSLIPIDGSHPFITKISNGNKVEFIFENIQLPFDDANNDGYIVFKIKTKPTLAVGDTFSNTASIYFDYNFPIVTEPAVTTVAVLAKSDFQLEQYVVLHPNPANNVLNIAIKGNIKISSVSIYNTLGQLLLVIPNADAIKAIDVSSLQIGNYFVKINSDKGMSSMKFIKQ